MIYFFAIKKPDHSLKKEIVYILTGGLNGNLSVVCGSQPVAEISTMNISTTTASSTTRYWSPLVLSLEPTSAKTQQLRISPQIPLPLFYQRNVYICGHQIDLKIQMSYFT